MLPSMPSLPTDNLYKFATVSGLFMIISSLYFLTSTINGFNQEVYRIGKTANYNATKIKILSKKIETDLLQYNLPDKSKLKLKTFSVKIGSSPRSSENISAQLDDIYKNTTEFAICLVELKQTALSLKNEKLAKTLEGYENEIMSNLQEMNDYVVSSKSLMFNRDKFTTEKIMLIGMMLSGYAILLAGILGWYSKFQRYQDELIALQVKSAKATK